MTTNQLDLQNRFVLFEQRLDELHNLCEEQLGDDHEVTFKVLSLNMMAVGLSYDLENFIAAVQDREADTH